VDSIDKVPEPYRDQLKTYPERYDHLSPDRRRDALRREEQGRQQEAGAPRPAAAQPAKKETRIVVDGNKVLVPVKIGLDGVATEAMLVLDTGASVIALHREVADRLDVREAEKGRMRILGGDIVDTEVVVLSTVTVGPVTRTGLRASIIDPQGGRRPYQGLLGMNFLRGLQYSIDFSNEVIRWEGGNPP
jgi:predicted aspartyl protease